MQGVPQIYDPLMALLQAGSQTIGSIRAAVGLADRPVEDMVQAISLAMSSGYAHPALPEAVRPNAQAGTQRLNAAICACNADDNDIGFLAAAAIGSGIQCGLLETLVVRNCLDTPLPPLDLLVDRVQAALAQSGRSLQRDGVPVSDPVQARLVLQQMLESMVVNRLPVLARLGIGVQVP